MSNYFSADISIPPFQMFSASHIAALAILTTLTIILVIWFAKRKTERSVDTFRYYFAAFILVNELAAVMWCAFAGVFTLDYALPIQLCDASAFLSVIMLVRDYITPFELVYFWGLGGSLQALLTPDLYYPFPHFMFFNFFIVHGAIIVAILYMVAAKGRRPTFRSVGKTFLYTNLYAGFVAVVNGLTGGNYMFLCSKPEDPSILDFLGPWPWYILSLEGVFIATCLLLYLPFWVMRFKKQDEDIA
jgi:conserved hypothetical integral membrane protein TIGR02206